MSFIMTAAPVNMHAVDHHSVVTTTWVIQSHVLAMFLPSLVSGRVIERFGERTMMLWGAVLMALCVGVNLTGHQVMHYWWGLVLLGVGWNLLFVAGTILLTRSLHGPERFRKQALADFAVFGSQACASLMAGVAVQALGWALLNAAALPLIIAMMIAASRLSVVRVDRPQVAT
jgi:MFS family permease